MSGKCRRYLVSYGVTTIVGGLLTATYIATHRLSEAETVSAKYIELCNAFSVPGMLFILVGLLLWCAGKGAFDGIAYSMSVFFRSINPFRKLDSNEKYYDYVQRKNGKRLKGYSFLFVIGFAFSVVALIFYLLSVANG